MGKKLSTISKGHKAKNEQATTTVATTSNANYELSSDIYYYHGPYAKYHFVNCEVAMKHHLNFDFMSNSIITSNIDAYYPILAENHARGLKLLTFYRIPGQMRPDDGILNPKLLVSFQGIHCSYGEPDNRFNVGCQLRVEKSVIQPEIVLTSFMSNQSKVETNTHHLFKTLARYADSGARLICIEITGQETLSNPSLFGTKMPALGVDMFFNIPNEKESEKYIYTCVCVPIHVTYRMGFTANITVECDWLGKLTEYNRQGWKLVEIFYDKTCLSKTNGFTGHQQMNSQWYFEKPARLADDPTPVYEGLIMEHEIHIKGYQTTTDWDSVMQKMGNSGWELACILETPEQRVSAGFVNTVHQKTLLFFQRRYYYFCGNTAPPSPWCPPENSKDPK